MYTYDRFLTFEREVDLIWRRRSLSVATGSYMLMHISAAVYLYTLIMEQTITDCRVSLSSNVHGVHADSSPEVEWFCLRGSWTQLQFIIQWLYHECSGTVCQCIVPYCQWWYVCLNYCPICHVNPHLCAWQSSQHCVPMPSVVAHCCLHLPFFHSLWYLLRGRYMRSPHKLWSLCLSLLVVLSTHWRAQFLYHVQFNFAYFGT